MQYLKHQTQPCPVSCVCTSIAILAGRPAAEIVEKYHRGYRDGSVSVRTMLTELGIPFATFDSLDGGVMDQVGAYLVTVPSLNITGGTHQIVIEITEDDYHVIDPVQGRAGRRYYTARGRALGDLEHELASFTLDAFVPVEYFAQRAQA